MTGALVVDKAEGWTSHDVVNKVRRLSGIKKIGHLGTLDPMATGVLPLVVGRATRLAQFYSRADKIYDATIRFGYATSTYDREGEPTSPVTEPVLDVERVEPLVASLRGELEHVPPPISAKKVGGVPAYKLARRNKPVALEPVRVTIHSIRILSIEGALLRIEVHCSGGTYLRTIAHDLGKAYGCGAHLSALRRLAAGEFRIGQARTIQELERLAGEGRLEEALIPCSELLPEFPNQIVDDLTASRIRQGRDFRVSPFRQPGGKFVKALTAEGDLVAIGEATLPHVYHPVLVL